MKNLKRALSLVLSAAMLVSMMVMGSGAADVTAEHNQEAIAMMQAAEIMIGDDKGNFNPDAKITRNEMAVVMSNMLGLDTDDFAGASNFTDVPAWAAPYVDACFANGIVSGASATQYNGSAVVTTREAALMMLKALGYFQYAGDFENDWALATIRQAAKISLLDGIDAGATAALTRNDVAQLALNALESKVVYATKSGSTTSITTDDVKIEVSGQATYNNEADTNAYNYAPDSDNVAGDLYLIEKLFKADFVKTDARTALGQPATKWTDTTKKLADQKIITVAKDAKYVVVVDAAQADTRALYKKYIDEDLKADDVINAASVTYAKDGVVGAETAYAIGDYVEIFTNSKGKITDVIVLDYQIGEITKINEKGLTNAEKEDGTTAKVSIKSGANTYVIKDNEFTGFDYEKGDYVLYVRDAVNNKIIASQLAETVEGKVASTKGNKATINGEKYIYAGATVGENGTFYLGLANEVLYADTVAASEDYLYVYSMKVDTTGRNADGVVTTVATAYTVDAEGVKASYDVALEVKDGVIYFKDTTVVIPTTGWTGVMAYSVNSDDQLVYETAKDAIAGGALTFNKGAANGATSATEFVFVNQTASAVKVKLATGYKNVNIAQTGYTVTNADGKVLLVFANGVNGSITSDANLAVVTDATPSVSENADEDATYTYAVVTEGVESELTFKAPQAFTKGQVIAYEFDGDWAVIDTDVTAATLTKKAVQNANEDYIKVTGDAKQYNLTGEEEIYTSQMEYKDGVVSAATLDKVTVYEGAEIDKLDEVIYTVTNDGDIDVLFVYEIVY